MPAARPPPAGRRPEALTSTSRSKNHPGQSRPGNTSKASPHRLTHNPLRWCARKPASTVLRGGRRCNAPPLPDEASGPKDVSRLKKWHRVCLVVDWAWAGCPHAPRPGALWKRGRVRDDQSAAWVSNEEPMLADVRSDGQRAMCTRSSASRPAGPPRVPLRIRLGSHTVVDVAEHASGRRRWGHSAEVPMSHHDEPGSIPVPAAPLSVPWTGLTDTSSTPRSWICSMSPSRCA